MKAGVSSQLAKRRKTLGTELDPFPDRAPSRFPARNEALGILHWGILLVSVCLSDFPVIKLHFRHSDSDNMGNDT